VLWSTESFMSRGLRTDPLRPSQRAAVARAENARSLSASIKIGEAARPVLCGVFLGGVAVWWNAMQAERLRERDPKYEAPSG